MAFRIFGKVTELETARPVAGVIVAAMDEDILSDETIGEATTTSDGSFGIEHAGKKGNGLFRDRPDVYLVVRSAAGKVLKTTRENVRPDVDQEIEINVRVPNASLAEGGLAERMEVRWQGDPASGNAKRFKTWTWRPDFDESDDLNSKIEMDLERKSSVLEVIKAFIDDLKGSADSRDPVLAKLARLFELGTVPDELEGHFYGVPVGIRSGNETGPLAGFGNILGFMWGLTIANVCPWVGKSFSAIDDLQMNAIASGDTRQGPVALGINHFNKIPFQPLNLATFHLLTWWLGLERASMSERAGLGHERDGGNFIAHRASSVYQATPRDVLRLNYRYPNLGNTPPLCWLIDELVKIAPGLYLGQLLFATKKLHSPYDPRRPVSDNGYRHFGYFVLFDESWNLEARRLFAHLDIPVTAPGVFDSRERPVPDHPRYSTFTFETPPPRKCRDEILERIRTDLSDNQTIMHLMKQYSDKLMAVPDNESTDFQCLREIFNRGKGVKRLEGFYRGALVSWRAEGPWSFLNINTLNLAWMKIGRYFSPWTGKSFEGISPEKLDEMTDGREAWHDKVFWGANTQSLRTPKEKFTGKLMQLAGVWAEEVPEDEARDFGYDLKCFFYIARQAKSVNEYNRDKDIFQLNYRWPKLRTIPPDCYCIDEIVQIAEGLYMGQLMYATNLVKPYDPLADPKEYDYRMFGYFLLMDEGWHRLRLDIGFDLENT